MNVFEETARVMAEFEARYPDPEERQRAMDFYEWQELREVFPEGTSADFEEWRCLERERDEADHQEMNEIALQQIAREREKAERQPEPTTPPIPTDDDIELAKRMFTTPERVASLREEAKRDPHLATILLSGWAMRCQDEIDEAIEALSQEERARRLAEVIKPVTTFKDDPSPH